MSQKKFIITQDKDVAKKLSAIFQQIDSSNGTWVFLNAPTAFSFSEADKKKVAFTNILNL